jgi:predicted transposase YdaD
MTMIKDKLLKQSTFYKETRDEGMSAGRESGVRSVLAARFGSVSDRLSGRIHSIMERNGSLFEDIIKLAATAKDMGEFERKLDRMA